MGKLCLREFDIMQTARRFFTIPLRYYLVELDKFQFIATKTAQNAIAFYAILHFYSRYEFQFSRGSCEIVAGTSSAAEYMFLTTTVIVGLTASSK